MTHRDAPAPIYADAFALCEWLLQRFGDDPRALPGTLCESGLALLASITLALKGRRREEQLESADERLVMLRTHLRLAAAAGYLSESQVIYGLETADRVGRQLGGWLRSLGPI